MRHLLTRSVSTIFAIALIAGGAWAGVAMAQEETSSAAVIHQANADIVFENAGMSNLPSARYQAFDQFATEHPEITTALARNPRLIENDSFINRHPALADFLRTHPDVASDFAKNPGNYVDMPLAVAASIKNNPIEQQ